MNISEYIANFFVKRKIDTAFGVTGGGAMFLNDAFRKSKIKFIFTHHEQSSSMAAEAYTRISKKPAILSVTTGPGGTNAITGVAGAWIDSIPMIVISGQVQKKDMINNTKTRQIGVQEINILDIVKPITKYSVLIKDEKKLEQILDKAYNIAISGRPGPVWIDVPLDVQSKEIKTKPKTISKRISINESLDEKKINKFAKLCSESKRPIIIVGNGVHLANAEIEFEKFYKKFQMPMITSWNASDLITNENKFFIGRMGLFGERSANYAVQTADLIIVLGCRLSQPMIGYNSNLFAPRAKKIIVDIDLNEIKNKGLNPVLYFKNNIKFLLAQINKLKIKKKENNFKWLKKLKILKERFPVTPIKEDFNAKKINKINSFRFIKILSENLKGGETIITDMGTSFTCTMQSFETKKNQRLFTSSGLAAMGFGIPGAIGSYYGNPKKKIICIIGDGGAMFNLQELQTIVSYKIPVKIFLINNEGYLTMKLMQKKNFKKFIGSSEKSGVSMPNFIKISTAFKIKNLNISSEKQLKNNIKKIINSNRSFFTQINMPTFQQLIPRVQSKLIKNGEFIPATLEIMYPFLNEDDHKKIMEDLKS